MVWMVCTPVAPVPITATRLPAKSTGSFGQRAVWKRSPLETVAALDARQRRRRQRPDRGDQEARREAAAVLQRDGPASRGLVIDGRGDAALNWMSRRRSNLSATYLQ